MLIFQDYGCSLQSLILADASIPLHVGIECEIEGIKSADDVSEYGWEVTQDGSLRNNGYEFISKAIPTNKAVTSFKGLHGTIVAKEGQKFSQRTSIHVHANCANLEANEVRNIILIYALFEEAFFLMCESERRDNIHCVPLTETYLPNYYKQTLSYMVSKWHKYTALNIKPLQTYGTIEFRHMQGHDDTLLLAEWLGAIEGLFKVGKSGTINSASLEPNALQAMFDQIFGKTRLRDHWVLVRGLMVNQIIDIKLSFV